jgi:hypothetical protein
MNIYVVSEIEGKEVEMLKAFHTMDSAIDYLNVISVLHQHDDVEFLIDPIELEE